MTSFAPGGTEGQMIELVRRLDSSRWSVYLVCFAQRGAWFERAAGAVRSVVEFPVTTPPHDVESVNDAAIRSSLCFVQQALASDSSKEPVVVNHLINAQCALVDV